MQLAILLAVICALAQGGDGGSVSGALWRTALTLAAATIAPLVAAVGSRRLMRGLSSQAGLPAAQCERIWSRVQALAVGLWLAIVALTMYPLAWPRVVRGNWSLGDWPLVDELLILLPVVLPLLLLWGVMHRLHWAVHSAPRAPNNSPSRLGLAQFIWQQVRQQLALILLPVLLVVGVQECLAAAFPQVEASGRAWLWYVPLLAAMLVLMPVALRRVWRTRPLAAGPLREQLTAICRAERAGVREILVWQTDSQVANAAVAGVLPGLRYVFLTDGLLARLTPGEVEAVLRHELGHVAGRHMLLRMLLLGLPLLAWMALQDTAPQATEWLTHALAQLGLPESLQISLGVPAGLAAYAILVVGGYSKRLEHDADLSVCISSTGAVDRAAAECFARALIKIVGRGRESRWSLWLHPAMGQRLALLALAVADPAAALRYRRRLARRGWGLVAAYLAAILLLLF